MNRFSQDLDRHITGNYGEDFFAADRDRARVRSLRRTVRNPLLALPATRQLLAMPLQQRLALRDLLRDLAKDARARADKCWRTHKAPMAAYWKAVAVYANHLARVLGQQP